MSIANRTSQTYDPTDLNDYAMEADALAFLVNRIIANRPDVASELAELLLITRSVTSGDLDDIRRVVNSIDQALELAFLESKSYHDSLKDWLDEIAGKKVKTPQALVGVVFDTDEAESKTSSDLEEKVGG